MLPPPASGDLKSHPELSARRTAHMSVMWVHHQFTRFEVSRPSHSTTSFMDPFFCNCGTKSNYCQLPSYIHHTATYLSLPPYLSYYNSTLPSFFLYSSSNLLLPTLISILLSYHVDLTQSLPSRSSHLHTVIPEANLLVALSPLLSQTVGNFIQILDVILPSH